MLIWKTLHVLSMVTMVTVFIGAEIFYAAAMRRRDVQALAFIQRTVERTGAGFIGLGGILLGIVFGLLTAATGGFDFTAGWLIVAYVLVAAFFVNAAIFGQRAVRAGKVAMEAVDGGASVDEATVDLSTNYGLMVLVVNLVLFVGIITDMVLKPF